MKSLSEFKAFFIYIFCGLTTYLVVLGLFDVDIDNLSAVMMLILKSLVISFGISMVLSLVATLIKMLFQKNRSSDK